jgi:hypothetical protein
MLTQALVQRRTRIDPQGMGAYSDKPLSVTAGSSDLARLEEEIDASLQPTARRRKLSRNLLPPEEASNLSELRSGTIEWDHLSCS